MRLGLDEDDGAGIGGGQRIPLRPARRPEAMQRFGEVKGADKAEHGLVAIFGIGIGGKR